MSQIGMSQAELDAIELRLIGCDSRPWAVSSSYDTNGRRFVMKGSKKSYRKAWEEASSYSETPDRDELATLRSQGKLEHGAHICVDGEQMRKGLCLFTAGISTTEDMLNFVASAPEDVEKLLKEVQFLRDRYRKCEEQRDEFRKEMLSCRAEKSSLQEKLTEMRRSIRAFGEVLREVSR